MKTIELIKILALIAVMIVVNGLFFEYCVSRDMETWMTLCFTIVIIVIDILAIKVLAKDIKDALKIE